MFTLSYIYLMIGVSLPFWINNVNGSKESSYIGLIALGLGDSIASLVGSKFGKTKWPGSNKSFEGSIAMALSILGGYAIFDFVGASAGVSTMETLSWTNRIMAAILCSAFEGIIDVNDNLFVPIFGYLIEELLFQFE
jgi:dolichol kinase